jgi:hypothetical protein
MTITMSGATISGGVVFEVAEAIANSINFDTAGANSWTVPAGVTSAVIKLWGGGGGGGALGYAEGGGGGGGGGYASKTLTVSGGSVLNFTVGSGGAAAPVFMFIYEDGSPGGASTYSTITAGGGIGGGDGFGGSGGTASGGDVNTSGQSGSYGGAGGYKGGLAGNSPNITANSPTAPFNGIQPGGGQGGGSNYGVGTGAVGRVRFEW